MMKPALASVVANVRLSGEWPTPLEFGTKLLAAGADKKEVVSITQDYKGALMSGGWPQSYGSMGQLYAAAGAANARMVDALSSFKVERDDDEAAADDFVASLRSFSLRS